MKGVIWTRDIEEGNEMLDKIIDNYSRSYISTQDIKISMNHGSSVMFNNGDYWQVRLANDCSRGVRSNIAYIQRNISIETYNKIIAPTIFNFPFSAIHLWGEGNLHICDEPLLPF